MKNLHQKVLFPFRDLLIIRGITIAELANVTRLQQNQLTAFCSGETPTLHYQLIIIQALQKHYDIQCKIEDLFICECCQAST